jgi:hypothetical protein
MHFWHTNRSRMVLLVEEDEALDIVHIPTFRPSALEFEADGLANEIEEFRFVIYRGPAV